MSPHPGNLVEGGGASLCTAGGTELSRSHSVDTPADTVARSGPHGCATVHEGMPTRGALSHCPLHHGASVLEVEASMVGRQAARGDVTSEENIRLSAFPEDNVASPGCHDVAAKRSLREAVTRSCLWAAITSPFPARTRTTCRDQGVLGPSPGAVLPASLAASRQRGHLRR